MIASFITQSMCPYIMSSIVGYKPWFQLRKRPDPLPKALVMRVFLFRALDRHHSGLLSILLLMRLTYVRIGGFGNISG